MDLFSTKVAYAVASKNVNEFVANVDNQIINPLIGFLFALALVFFLYGVFEFIASGASDEKKTTGKSHMLWGIVGITIMLSVWTILNIILNTLNIKGIDPQKGTVNLPEYKPPR
ncbi:hypothetical protein A2643_02795 [Candidatus Nomurabacteria bacterium RIFCSPHIGHO2_01_FULL_39_220]|uniref:Uncharacterized protein n=1 Tax=Candidatus Nomurabacteria bacterium RIFCSPLOWO2_02_FULL_40_67 TaxID=1801787 RepID=A0A1F6Y5Z4_9BACT|nr:MAG: hypothetical protein UU01_C0029G0011 [Parcubacteria group bacterium GW2011_GWA2_40_37]KKS71172.1 MAG: hypothetical protein UV43_C0044G0012 [Parcubacteria group bacterium GW2011_GWF2_42_7]OGI70115.1 MAG: hypothetical protein A2643_02795 [Candidatus Nomurabacteria bacterium RIFCSPHIGHO2_01_FULL_39_220]OGI72873.1 MAG: hypothetical protein A2W56_04035 [Candidatus Nomurabacteria bacterium RIFCSPHIGHO2_02_41_18]OGI78597.1 MAG: hypothetical protein A3C65_01045 [Candidatus Nomurabacteria bacter